MNIENEHVQQPSSASSNSSSTDTSANHSASVSSGSSSNNSSNSNLLVNLPMLHTTSSVEDADDEVVDEEQLPLPIANQQQTEANATAENNTTSSSLFISPLLFNNNLTTAASSGGSSSSSSSSSSTTSTNTHNLHTFQQAHELQQQEQLHLHTEHHHSPPPTSPQLNALLSTATIQTRALDAIDNNNAATVDLASSTSSQQPTASGVGQLLLPISSSSSSSSSRTRATTTLPHIGVPAETEIQQTPVALSLPYTNNPSTYAHHQTTHSTTSSSLHYQYHQHSHHFHTPEGCSNILGNNNNNHNMFNSNEANNCAAATTATANAACNNTTTATTTTVDRLKLLYPNVDESKTPLPRCWSAHDKCLAIGLSQNNLRVHYKGKYNLESTGKQHNDAASVRTAHPIPAACGLYYFEVKIVSKGKNGYMGIGLTAQQFRMNRLPGWDKQSYGYHGDDGNSFSSSGNGQSYGPTFTTGDIIGCCVNFVNNTCFYTKNGIDLGIAFRDLPTKLYPTVGLQTPGEEVDANFGQEPFKFDQIEDMMKQMRAEMKTAIYDFSIPPELGDHTALLHKLVSSYLVHNGYTQTIESFARSTGQTFREELPSIRSRQKILKLVMAGQMGQAIDNTLRYYPGLLENNKKLWFTLKCRQFIEMINGSDEYCPNKITTQTQTIPPNQTSVIQSTKSYQNSKGAVITTDNNKHNPNFSISDVDTRNGIKKDTSDINIDHLNDVEMENNGHALNGDLSKNEKNYHHCESIDEEMDIDIAAHRHTQGIERILEFGKELFQMSQQLEKESHMTVEDRQMLENAFSLIAYSNPWSSPMGWQLCPSKRETVCTALNSAILESLNYAPRPPLNVAVAHAAELLKLMAHTSIGACAFVNIEDIFPQN